METIYSKFCEPWQQNFVRLFYIVSFSNYGIIYYINKQYRRIKDNMEQTKKFEGPKRIIICEKPSVGTDFSKVLGTFTRKNGYFENDEWIITWSIGHLVTLSYPEVYNESLKKWSLETLPFLPEKYKYEVIKNVKDQYDVVKQLYHRNDISELLIAGDSGREGEYIQRLILMQAGINPQIHIRRIWIDSYTDASIRQGIKDAKDLSFYDKMSESASMRAIEDYAVGINFSRAMTVKFGYEFNQKIKSEKRKPIAVGRVMTCVLGMVVELERTIRSFKPTPFYKIEADTGFRATWKADEQSQYFESPKLYDQTGFKMEKDAALLKSQFDQDKRLYVENITNKIEKKKAPLLFNLAELQAECSKQFKISPDKTLEVAQALYEAKLTTYPRTDARVLSTPIADVIEDNLDGLSKGSYHADIAEKIILQNLYKGLSKSHYTDDSKITDHYAIIPTGETDTDDLNDLQLAIYKLIVDRFLSIFYPPAEYNKIEVLLKHPNGEHFYASEKILNKLGWMEITGTKDEKVSTIHGINKGDILNATFDLKSGQTSPPSRYTSGSIVLAMENAGKLIEDEDLRAEIQGKGIGTSSTRAETIKKLIKIGYITLNSKTQVIKPHADGEVLYDIIHEHIPSLLSPKMTASWEKGLNQIAEGQISGELYKEKLYNYVRNTVAAIKNASAPEDPGLEPFESEQIGNCPVCNGKVMTTRFGCACENYRNKTCGFGLNKEVMNLLGQEQFDKLLYDHKTDLIKGLKAKSGKTFNAFLVVDTEKRKVGFEFENSGAKYEKEDTSIICGKARCKKKNVHMVRTGSLIRCPECGTKCFTVCCKKELTDDELQAIVNGEKILISGLIGKSGKFSATVHLLRGGEGKLKISFK